MNFVDKVVIIPGSYNTCNDWLELELTEKDFLTWFEVISDMRECHKKIEQRFDLVYTRYMSVYNLVAPSPLVRDEEDEKAIGAVNWNQLNTVLTLALRPFTFNPYRSIAPPVYVMDITTWSDIKSRVHNKYGSTFSEVFNQSQVVTSILCRKKDTKESSPNSFNITSEEEQEETSNIFICWGNKNYKLDFLFDVDGIERLLQVVRGIELDIVNPFRGK
jgi:hypothetical protein